MLEGKTQPTGAYIFYTIYIYFVHIFLLILPLGSQLHMPLNFFIFATPSRDPHLRPHFATPIRDLISRPTFTTHVSRLTFATPFRDSCSRLPLATRVRDSTRDSCSRLLIAPPTATRYFFVTTSVVRLHH